MIYIQTLHKILCFQTLLKPLMSLINCALDKPVAEGDWTSYPGTRSKREVLTIECFTQQSVKKCAYTVMFYLAYIYFIIIFRMDLMYPELASKSLYKVKNGFKLTGPPPECWDYTCMLPCLDLCNTGDQTQLPACSANMLSCIPSPQFGL